MLSLRALHEGIMSHSRLKVTELLLHVVTSAYSAPPSDVSPYQVER